MRNQDYIILAGIILLAGFLSFKSSPPIEPEPQPQPWPIPIPQPVPFPIPIPIPQPVPQPKLPQVNWTLFSSQRQDSHNPQTAFLKDIANHLNPRFANQYYFKDPDTWAHETTHGIHSDLRMQFCKGNDVAFYIGGDKAVIISQPKLKLKQIGELIPRNLRGSRYQTYFVSQLGGWNDVPLYVFDEWVAYTNGATVGLETPAGKDHTDAMLGPLEFSIYAMITCIAIDKYDPEYLNTNLQYKAFVAHELKRSIGIYRKGIVMPQYTWDTQLPANVQQNQECIRILRKMFGDEITMDSLFKEPL